MCLEFISNFIRAWWWLGATCIVILRTHWQDRYFPFRTVRGSGTCWSVPFWSCMGPRIVSCPALHDCCLSSMCESRAYLDCVILCNYWFIMIGLGPEIDTFSLLCNLCWHLQVFIFGNIFFHFGFGGPSEIYCVSWFIYCEIFHKFCPGPTWPNPYLILVEGSPGWQS